MSTYSNRLQPALQNLLQRVVRFFHPRSSCQRHPVLLCFLSSVCMLYVYGCFGEINYDDDISADVCGRRKSLVKPVMRQNISSSSVLSPEIVMHDDSCISGRSENNIKCVVHDDLRRKNRTTYILPCHWLY